MTSRRIVPKSLAWVIAVCLAFALAGKPAAAAETGGGEAAPAIASLIGTGLGRAPEPGEWLEYQLCYQADPLEASLSPRPRTDPEGAAPPPAGDGLPAQTVGETDPAFTPPPVWHCLPLRLEIQKMEEGGCRAILLFAGHRRDMLVPLPKPDGDAAIASAVDPSDPETRVELGTQRVGDASLDVEIMRGHDAGGWFARYVNYDVPFGLVRFASENLDCVLVGMGKTAPPEFPVKNPHIDPAPGELAPKRQ